MPINHDQQQQIIALTVGTFNAALGFQYLEELTEVYEANNNSLEALANFILNTPAFNAQYAGAQTQQDIITNALALLGVEEGADAYPEAATFFSDGLAQGQSEASLLVEAVNYLNSDDVAPAFANIAATFQNKVEVATYLSLNNGGEETDITNLKGVLEGVTQDPQSVEEAIAQIDDQYPPTVPGPEPVTMALQDLQDANEAKFAFLTEDAITREFVLAQFASGDYDSAEGALAAIKHEVGNLSVLNAGQNDGDSIEGAVALALSETEQSVEQALSGESDSAYANAQTALGEYFEKMGELNNGSDFSFDNAFPNIEFNTFAAASRNLQDTFINEAQSAASEATKALEAEVGSIPGLSERIAALQDRKAEFEAAVKADVKAEQDVNSAFVLLSNLFELTNPPEDQDRNRLNNPDNTRDFSEIREIYDPSFLILERIDGTWQLSNFVLGLDTEIQSRVNDLKVHVQAAYDADVAKDMAEERFKAAIERVVEAEMGDEFNNFDAARGSDYGVNEEGSKVTLSITDISGGPHAPLSQALIDQREAQTSLDYSLAGFEEARALSDTLESRDNAITAAKDIFVEDFGLTLNEELNGTDNATAEGSNGDDLFLFVEANGNAEAGGSNVINLFGEQGQDHIFFGNTEFNLVELGADESIEDRVGAADQLEVFWQQNGANLELFVESEAAAGNDQNAENVTKVTLTEFTTNDIFAFQDGLLSTALVEVM